MAVITLNPRRTKGTISKNIYGHFSEHLGRCIYQGYFVGKDSPIPNVNGIRKDVVEALRNIRIPVLRWPGAKNRETSAKPLFHGRQQKNRLA